MQNKKAQHKLITDSTGIQRYKFFCDLSGALEYTSPPISDSDSETQLEQIWNNEAKKQFNHCKKCGKWVDSLMFNADVLECVACAPWEEPPKYCPHCGTAVKEEITNCTVCKNPLRYEGEV